MKNYFSNDQKKIANFIRYRNNKKRDLTYILGARCKDGIVLVSDSRITRGNDITQDIKLFRPITNAVIGASGVTGIFTKFLNQINALVESGQIKSWDELLTVIEDLVRQLDQRYRERTLGSIDVLMSTKKLDDSAELYLVTSEGLAEEIKNFVAIGHGEPYGSLFLKIMWNKEMTMEQTAELGSFIIATIAWHAVDNSVDAVPQIWYIPYKGDIRQLTPEEQTAIVHKSYLMRGEFDRFLKRLLNNENVARVLEAEKHVPE